MKNICLKCGKITSHQSKLCISCALIKRWNKPGGLWRDKEWLKKQYFNNHLSFVSIGKLAGCTGKTVEHFFKKFGLTPRYTGRTDAQYSPNWKGGRSKDARGYIRIFYQEQHPYKGKNQKYVLEHILVMEKIIGRKLSHPEIIHHKNGIPNDNRPENLQLFSNPFEHNTYEQLLGKFTKSILFGDALPHLKKELNEAFNNFYSSINKR